jgi:hypothetical protein
MGTTLGVLTGLIVFLATALIGVIAANGADNPGVRHSLESAAAGSTAAPAELKAGSYSALDLNRDGKLSLAEAAGNSEIVTRFDRADRRKRDGQLTQAEFDRLAKLPPPKAKAKVSQATIRRDAATSAATVNP